MIVLDTTSKTLQVVLSGSVTTNQLRCTAHYEDITATSYTPASTRTATNNTTIVTLVSAPSASTQRNIRQVEIYNKDTVAATVFVQLYDGANTDEALKVSLNAGDTLHYGNGRWYVTDSSGNVKTTLLGGAGNDTTAIHDNESGEINAISEKTTLANDDVFVIEDSAASYVKKRVKASRLPTLPEYDYVEFSSNVSVTATTEGTADTIVTSNSISFDGSTAILIEFFCANARPDSTAVNRSMTLYLYADGGSIGSFGQLNTPAAAGDNKPIYLRRRLTPSNASHTYSVRAAVNAGTGVCAAGAGGGGANVPGFIRITKAN